VKKTLFLKEEMIKDRGFTLLELLIALFLSTLVAVTLAMALRFSLGVWWRGTDKQQMEINFFKLTYLLEKQLRYAGNIKSTFFHKGIFSGDKTSLVFATDYSLLTPNRASPVLVRYACLENMISYQEMPFTNMKEINEFLKEIETITPIQLELPVQCCFLYVKDNSVKESWLKERQSPDAVKMEAELKGEKYQFIFWLK